MPGNGMITLQELLDKRAPVAVVGLGYVGLPLACALTRHFQVIGFDIGRRRIEELQQNQDHTGEVDPAALAASGLRFTHNPADLAEAAVVIVAVPTPIDGHRNPDLGPLRSAAATVGAHLRPGAVVVFESTVYPGVTEEVCLPILEKASNLVGNKDFTVGYSPERINPGDKVHTVDKIIKVVSGSTPETLDLLAGVYGQVVTAGIHKAPSIKVAEAAKVIENTQRDLNIALMNELAVIFERLGIDTLDVLKAAGTKWNFLPFRPGLVGGHCIGVDPYYLTFKAQEVGYNPEVILAGRRINDGMGTYVAQKVVKLLARAGKAVQGARVGIFGLTFKENVPDLRNTRVLDICAELAEYSVVPLVHDPLANAEEAMHEYGLSLVPLDEMANLDAAVFAVAHDAYADFDLQGLCGRFNGPAVVLDLKGLWSKREAEALNILYWRL